MLKRLYDRLMVLAADRHAVWWLAAVAFVESSVFPIPPDVMLIPMVIADRRRAWMYALVATAASVAGGWLGYAIGHFAFDTIGQGIIAFFHMGAGFDAFRAQFDRYGGWIVLAKGLTPIPFKLVTITCGFLGLDPLVFTISSIGSRAVRFFLVAGLFYFYGEPIRDFVERRLVLVTSAFLVALIGGFLVLRFL
jgi:membrane protein YqaA with SNARE-associated domain